MMERCFSTCFQYRLPRAAFRFPLRLYGEGVPVDGYCLNLSETGFLAHLQHPIAATGPCTVRMGLPAWTVDLRVEPAYSDRCRAGFRFLFFSEQQRQFVRALLGSYQQTAAWPGTGKRM